MREEVLQPVPLNDLVAVRATLRLMVDIVTFRTPIEGRCEEGELLFVPSV